MWWILEIIRRHSRWFGALMATLAGGKWLLRVRQSLLPRMASVVAGGVSSLVTRKVKEQLELMRWRNRVFLHRLQAELLSVRGDGRVEKRTLFEGNLLDTIMNGNEAAAALCSRAAAKCSDKLPFLTQHLPAQERYQVLNNALNLVSSFCRDGHIAEDIAPGSTVGCWYVFSLLVDNRQQRPELPNTKVRITLVKEDTLQWLASCQETTLLEHETRAKEMGERHLARWRHLKKMARVMEDQRLFHDSTSPQRTARVMHVLRVFLSVPAFPPVESSSLNNFNSSPARRTVARKSLRNVYVTQSARESRILPTERSPAMYSPFVVDHKQSRPSDTLLEVSDQSIDPSIKTSTTNNFD